MLLVISREKKKTLEWSKHAVMLQGVICSYYLLPNVIVHATYYYSYSEFFVPVV